MGSDNMLLRFAYHKAFMVRFLESVNGRTGSSLTTKEAWSGIDRPKTNTGTGAGIQRWGLRSGHIFSL